MQLSNHVAAEQKNHADTSQMLQLYLNWKNVISVIG